MSVHREGVILTATMGRWLEDDEKGDHDERRDHQQLVIVDVSDDLRLASDHGVECGTSGGSERTPKPRYHRILEHPVDGSNVLRNVGVVYLRVRCQQTVHH